MKETIKKLIPYFLLDFHYYFIALIGAFLCGFPGRSNKIKIIGITGTSGKSTSVDMASKILEEGGYKTAALSSVKFKIGEKEWQNKLKMTMPGRMKLQKFLRQAINNKCQFAVLEITSEGIRQNRHKFINFDAAVFTNLTPEHIESHGGFNNYRNEKLKLFKAAKNLHIINIDDKNAEIFLKEKAEKKLLYGLKGEDSIKAENIQPVNDGISFEVKGVKFHINLIGEFNAYNALSAICAGLAYGISLETMAKALEKIKGIPGRMEIVLKEPFAIVVDYAHTPKQLESVYKSFEDKRLICVLGSCGGGRDKWKRPVLGELAKKYCEEIIITNEDPYDEDPIKIIDEVAKGAGDKAEKVLDRKEAIKKAIEKAELDNVVIITGKGSEPWMCVKNNKKIPWDDREIAKELTFKKLASKK